MTKRILILLFAVLLTGMSEDVNSDCSNIDSDNALTRYEARGGDYAHGKKPPPVFGVYQDDDTDHCVNSLDPLDPVDQESEEEQY